MTKDKSEPKEKCQQLKRDLMDLADKLKCLAARFEACGFMPSINQYASEINRKASELYYDVAVKTWPGDKKGEIYWSGKSADDLSQDEAYAVDLVVKVLALTEKKYLKNANPQQASIEMVKVADLIQLEFEYHEAKASSSKTEKTPASVGKEADVNPEKSLEILLQDKFTFSQDYTQAFFDKKDIEISSGPSIKILKLLVNSMPNVVKNQDLNEASDEGTSGEAQEQLRSRISSINKNLCILGIPCHIENRRGSGYIMREGKRRSRKRPSKRK